MLDIQKKLTKSFYAILSLPATAMGFALSIQISALSWILVTKFGLHLDEMGFVWAAGPIAGLIAQPLVGLLSDNVWFMGGRRRPFIIFGGILAALMLLGLPNIGVINDAIGVDSLIGVALVVALTLDLSINVSFNPTRSIIADVTPEGDDRTRGYTWMQTISGTFGVLAYAIGAVWGNYFLIYFGAGLVLVLTIFPSLLITEKRKFTKSKEDSENQEIATPTNWKDFLKVNFANSFSWLGVQTMFVYIIAFISQKINPTPDGATHEVVKMIDAKTGQIISISFLILNAVGAILPVVLLEPLSKKIGRNKTQGLVVGIMAVSYLVIAIFVRSEYMLYVMMAFAGIGWAGIVSLPFASMSETVDKSRMGFFMGLFNMSIVIPQLIVSLVFGTIILNSSNKEMVFLIAAVTVALSSLLWFFVKDKKH